MSDLQNELDNYELEQVVAMLKLLAVNLSKRTKIQLVPRGTSSWRIFIEPFSVGPVRFRITRDIRLQPFFGMMVGYDQELDLLVYWAPR